MDYRKTTAPCGIDCFNCELFKDNITDEIRKRIAPYAVKNPDTFQCEGCRVSGCAFIQTECETKKCVNEKGHEFCFECDSFPCNRLHPCSDRASTLPHNFKLYNLCKIKSAGFEEWLKEASTVRKKYYKGKMIIGTGPVVE